MRRNISFLLIFLGVVAVLVAGTGCETPTGDDGSNQPGALGWALDIARGETTVDDLIWIRGMTVNAGGLVGETGHWTFIFIDLDGSLEEFYVVVVFSSGGTYSYWQETYLWDITSELPGYRNAKGWVEVGDTEIAGTPFATRSVTVWAGDSQFHGVDNVCAVQYLDEYGKPEATVFLDADTNEVLWVE